MDNQVTVHIEGATVRAYDSAGNFLKAYAFRDGCVDRFVRWAAKHGYTLKNVRNGRIWV